jgi:hypothetical protein
MFHKTTPKSYLLTSDFYFKLEISWIPFQLDFSGNLEWLLRYDARSVKKTAKKSGKIALLKNSKSVFLNFEHWGCFQSDFLV